MNKPSTSLMILLCLPLLLLVDATKVSAQKLELPAAAVENDDALAKAMPGLAKQMIAIYEEPDRVRYLDALFRLQIVAGQYQEALATLRTLTELRQPTDPASVPRLLPFEILAKAKVKQAASMLTRDEAFKQEFRDAFDHLDDKSAYEALFWFRADLSRAHNDLSTAVEKQKGKDGIALTEALDLVRKYQFYYAFQVIMPLIDALAVADDNKRYIIEDSVLIKTKEDATLSAMVVRKKGVSTPQPAALFFNIYTNLSLNAAKRAAAYGYVGVAAETRGKRFSPDEMAPYEHEAKDTYDVIDWVSKQSWSNGKVGMYGGSYSGFACWAATKTPHPALKTIVPYVANNPGDGLPMENNVFLFVNYAWAFYVSNNKYLDEKTYFDRQRWNSLNEKWYASGKSYRQIDSIDGTPNKWLQRWLQHPSYDKYWQDMVPYKHEFAKINIPVLTITGYYDDGQQSALHYLKEHYKYNKNANHYLLIGPYDHFGAQGSRKPPVLRGYVIDPVAQIDTPDITFQWLDYVLRDGKKPELLKDKINYQVMGANEWKHAPSLEKMSNEVLTLYLTDRKSGDHYQLAKDKPSKPGFLYQEVDFADRKTTNNDYYPAPIVGKKPDLSNGFSFISEPFEAPVEINGTFLGEIKASLNKKDVDIGIVVYEVMPNGELFHLSYFLGRASYAKDMSVRKLLTPGKVESIPFDKTRLVSRRLSKGSRLLVTLNINKNPFAQINYGTGKDVSDEDINDAKTPLQIKWQNDSWVKVPIWK